MSTNTTISIRRAKPGDLTMLAAVFDAAWREAYQGIIPGVALEHASNNACTNTLIQQRYR